MAKQTNIYQPVGYNTAQTQITAGDTTTKLDLFTAGANDSYVSSIVVTSESAAAETIALFIHDGSNARPMGSWLISTKQGNQLASTSYPTDLLESMTGLPLIGTKKVITLKTGWKLQVAAQATVSGNINVIAQGADF